MIIVFSKWVITSDFLKFFKTYFYTILHIKPCKSMAMRWAIRPPSTSSWPRNQLQLQIWSYLNHLIDALGIVAAHQRSKYTWLSLINALFLGRYPWRSLIKIVILQIVQPGCIYSIQSTVLSAVSLPITMLLGKLNLIIVPRISKSGVCNKETKKPWRLQHS